MSENLRSKRYYILTFVLTFGYRMLGIGGTYTIRAAADDIGMLGGAAFFAGYDWSAVVSTTGYYGIGWYSLFAPILRLMDNSVTVWMIITIMNILVVAICCVFSQYIGIKYLGMPNNMITCLIAVICSLAAINPVTMSQEPILYCLTWIIAYLFMRSVQGNISVLKTFLFIVIMSVVCIYAYLIHTRAIVFLVAVPLALMVVQLMQKKMEWRWYICFGLVAVGMFFFADHLKAEIIKAVWGQTTDIRNAELQMSDSILRILSLDGIRVVFDCIVSNLFTASMKLYGMISMVIVLMVINFCNIFRREKNIGSQNDNILLFFSGICFFLGVAGVAVGWGKGVVSVYWTHEVVNSYKGFAYFRYYGTFLGPALFVALKDCYIEKKNDHKVAIGTLILQGVIICYWLFVILQKISKSRYTVNAFNIFLKDGYLSGNALNCVLSIEAVLLILVIMLFAEKKREWGMVGALLLSIITMSNGSVSEKGILSKPQMGNAADSGCYLVRQMENDKMEFDNIYSTNIKSSYHLQFFLKDRTILLGLPKENENSLIFSVTPSRENGELGELPDNYKCFKLDDNEYVWVSNEELYHYIMDLLALNNGNDRLQEFVDKNMAFIPLETNETGYAMYGPYIDLNPGSYEVTFQMPSDLNRNGEEILGTMEVACELGNKMICAVDWDGRTSFVTLSFELEEFTDDIEFRYLKKPGNETVPLAVKIVSHPSN